MRPGDTPFHLIGTRFAFQLPDVFDQQTSRTDMWISSFVVTLPQERERVRNILGAISAVSVFELGPRNGRRQPVVLEAIDGSTARYWHEWVERLPGVINVEVAFVSFDNAFDAVPTEPQEVATQ